MAVEQPNKSKVRPVMDYRELNSYVKSFPGQDTAVCGEKLREWRKMGNKVTLLDLKKAYLQLFIDIELQRFQTVRFRGIHYVMTRMGFGLNVAPKVMSKVLHAVLSLLPSEGRGTDAYIDDIVVNESMVAASAVRAHLLQYGLVTKEPVPLDGARVQGPACSQKSQPGVCVVERQCSSSLRGRATVKASTFLCVRAASGILSCRRVAQGSMQLHEVGGLLWEVG